jgi:hypothetical protein
MQRDPVVKLSEILFEEEELKRDPEELMQLVVSQLTDDLRRAPYKGDPNPLTGHCYVASEALFHLLGSDDWKPCNISHEGSPHWYLMNKRTGEKLDPTAGQFKTPVPYELGKGKGFLTKLPSKRAMELLRRLNSL